MGDSNQTVELLDANFAASTPLGRALAGRYYHESGDWNCQNVERFISCVGVVDLCLVGAPGVYDNAGRFFPNSSDDESDRYEQATFNIGVTDTQWIEHLRPGMEWENWGFADDGYVAWHPAWGAPIVLSIAKNVEESQDFSGLPILADALQEAGYDEPLLLDHLRNPEAAHVRGCWALDYVLDKEQRSDD